MKQVKNTYFHIPNMRFYLSLYFVLILSANAFSQSAARAKLNIEKTDADIKVGAERTAVYLPMLIGKNVAVVANQTSLINSTSLIDSLISLKIKVKKIFCPEHGFRGVAENGEEVSNAIDLKTGLPIISLYGDHLKPTTKDLSGIDVVVYCYCERPNNGCCLAQILGTFQYFL